MYALPANRIATLCASRPNEAPGTEVEGDWAERLQEQAGWRTSKMCGWYGDANKRYIAELRSAPAAFTILAGSRHQGYGANWRAGAALNLEREGNEDEEIRQFAQIAEVFDNQDLLLEH